MTTEAQPTDRDLYGRAFDPTKFRPEKDVIGRWKNLRGGRKPKIPSLPGFEQVTAKIKRIFKRKPKPTTPTMSTVTPPPEAAANPTPDPAASAPPAAATAPAPTFADIDAAARGEAPTAVADDAQPTGEFDAARLTVENPTAETIIGAIQTALVLMGDDEGILSPTEKTLLRRPLERVLKKYGVGNMSLPPEADLAFAVAGLVIVRLQKPKTATFAAKARRWFVGVWSRREGRALAHELRREVPLPPSAPSSP